MSESEGSPFEKDMLTGIQVEIGNEEEDCAGEKSESDVG